MTKESGGGLLIMLDLLAGICKVLFPLMFIKET